jgi:hypothetical protein
MALYDWNRDGKKDMRDDFIEYMMYEEAMKENKEQDPAPKQPKKEWSFIEWIVITAIGFVILDLLGL